MNKEILALAMTSLEEAPLLKQEFEEEGFHFQLQTISSLDELAAALKNKKPELVFVEYPHPESKALDSFDFLRQTAPQLPVIAISGQTDAETVVAVMRAGARDFFIKGKYDQLVSIVKPMLKSKVFPMTNTIVDLPSHEQDSFFRNMVENAPVAITIFTLDGIQFANPYALRLIGAKHFDEVFGTSFLEFVHPEDRTLVKRIARHAWEKSLPPVEERLVRLDGKLVNAEITSGPIVYEGEKAVISSFIDIDDRIRNRRASRQRLFQIQVAAEIARDATAARNTDDLLDSAVRLIYERFGYYHVAIFLNDERNNFTVLAAAEGEAGQKLLEMNHGLEIGKVGIVGHVAGSGEPRIASNVAIDELHLKQPLLLETRSEMALPLIVEKRVMGVLDVQSREEAAFIDQDISILSIVADQLAVAIDKTRLLSEVKQRADELSGLYDAALATSSELDADKLLSRLHEQVQVLIEHDSFMVALYDDDQAVVTIVIAMEKGEPLQTMQGLRYPISDGGLTGWVIENKQTLLCSDLQEDRLPARPIYDPQSSDVTKSWLGVPLIAQDRVMGMVSIQSFNTHAFDEGQRKFFETLVAQAGIAFENANLFETVEKRASELEILLQVSLQLTASLDPQAVLDAILDGVFELLPGTRTAHIFTYDGEFLSFGSALMDNGRRGTAFSKPRPDGLTYKVARSGEMIVVPDMSIHPIYDDVPEEIDWIGSIIGLPLKISDRVVGVMNVSFHDPRSFSETELRILRLLGDQAAFGIENANLFNQTNVERRFVALLYDIGRVLSQSLDPKKILGQAIRLTCQALGGTSGVTLFLDKEKQRLYPAAIYDSINDTLGNDEVTLDIGEGLAGWVAQQKRPDIIADVRADERWYHVASTDEDVLSAISAPITEDVKVIGTLSVHHNQLNAFTEDQLPLMEAICQQVSLAYSNATRYQEINRLVDRLAAQQFRLESLIRELPIGLLLIDRDRQLVNANLLGQEYLASLAAIEVGNRISKIGSSTFDELLEHQDDLLPVEVTSDEDPPRRFELQVQSVVGGEIYEWILVIRDVTREREIQERVQMQNRLATVGQLAAGIAHDFNNIMAAIVIYADLLKTDRGLSESSLERLSVIQQQVKRASSLIRQILDFSRRSVMEQIELDLLPFVKEIEKLLQRMLPETIQTKLYYDEGQYRVFVDPTRIQQVIMNLAVNARDAMPEGGEIRFELAPIHLRDEDEMPSVYITQGDWICLSVIDTGVGIQKENLQRVFEPFFTTKDVGKGTGLGLAQVYGIVKQHGGYIDVDSQLEKGTAFHIYLPELKDEHKSKEGEPDVEHVDVDGAGRLVVLAEDDAPTRSAVQAMLEASNFEVQTARHGLEALTLIEVQANRVELVISDVVMPLMGGVDLYDQLKWRWPKIKVLFITGHPLEGKAGNLLSQGEISWLQKPFSVQELQSAIFKVLEEPR
jgi:PAS domain S-box-containing protein